LKGGEGLEGWGRAYGDHDHFRAHQPLGGVPRAAEVELEEVDEEEAWERFEDWEGEGDAADAIDEEVAEEGDRHGGLSAFGWEVLVLMWEIGLGVQLVAQRKKCEYLIKISLSQAA